MFNLLKSQDCSLLVVIFLHVLNTLALAAIMRQIVPFDLFICEKVELIQFDRCLQFFRVVRRKQAAVLEVGKVEAHQDSHAHTFEQPQSNVKHLLAETIIEIGMSSANVVVVDCEPDKVGECKEEGNDGINAALSPQGVHDCASVLLLSSDRSLRLDEQPDHQRNHHDDLA